MDGDSLELFVGVCVSDSVVLDVLERVLEFV
jgi:hypothetical protein